MPDLEETGGVDPVIQERCAECGAKLTAAEVQAALESGGPYLCQVHALENLPLEDEDEPSG
ncbi:MAG TPA: hypothetical protein VE570_10675 [Thermoleophilaceae bacterium]|jgi:hypothetical protein|nr:hypothetical protein [Thermoleophilaceae bacterium]